MSPAGLCMTRWSGSWGGMASSLTLMVRGSTLVAVLVIRSAQRRRNHHRRPHLPGLEAIGTPSRTRLPTLRHSIDVIQA